MELFRPIETVSWYGIDPDGNRVPHRNYTPQDTFKADENGELIHLATRVRIPFGSDPREYWEQYMVPIDLS